jgi:hypothetical protein
VTFNALVELGLRDTTLTTPATFSGGKMSETNGAAVPVDFGTLRDRLCKKYGVQFGEGESQIGGLAGQSDAVSEIGARDRSGVDPGSQPVFSVVARLKRKFGLGDQPAKRLKLYQRLERLAALHGEVVLAVISEAVCSSAGKDKPGRYFCRAVCGRLADLKLSENGGDSYGSW